MAATLLSARSWPRPSSARTAKGAGGAGAMQRGKCLVLACGALAREVIALKAQLGLADDAFELQCLPAELHNRPSQIAPRVEAVLSERRGQFDRVLIGYGECGTGGALDAVLAGRRRTAVTR